MGHSPNPSYFEHEAGYSFIKTLKHNLFEINVKFQPYFTQSALFIIHSLYSHTLVLVSLIVATAASRQTEMWQLYHTFQKTHSYIIATHTKGKVADVSCPRTQRQYEPLVYHLSHFSIPHYIQYKASNQTSLLLQSGKTLNEA